MDIGLVSCTKSKREHTAPPKDLYDESAFFRKARQFALANHDDWYILSAKHGLLDPDGEPIEPYDETLSGASVKRKRNWSKMVYTQLSDNGLLTDETRLVFHAGRDYYDELVPLVDDADATITIETPTDGLQYGETLAWYNDHL
ncbi:DUF6884 domain-containing protein [Haloferax volcanii]|uniref:DUF6884 domain-containing protein n=1 Tax=Haloferax volcanii TaxID=2246 RepID=A0A847TR81_HALVO|nr:DUF6884 domain-containing protein [Haloferax alexandrinus]NLV02989.1 hypothetical protein [Haloferax alexandrinus]